MRLLVAIACILLAACQPVIAAPSTPSAVVPPSSIPSVQPTCIYQYDGAAVLPDSRCTPGATDPRVTQDTIQQTICDHKPEPQYLNQTWSQFVRPDPAYTRPLKLLSMQRYGDTGPAATYEFDHLISLELGGAPRDTRNLWAQPMASPNPKDRVENAANRAVCNGSLHLADAQQMIAANWVDLGRRLGVPNL